MQTEHLSISLDKDYEVRHWMRTLDCTQSALYDAVRAVGKRVPDLRAYLAIETGPDGLDTAAGPTCCI